jgi:excisionase family DNA binding protein
MERLLLRVDEASQYLGFSKSMLYRLVQDGEIPAVVLGKTIRFSVPMLQEWARTIKSRPGEMDALIPDGQAKPVTRTYPARKRNKGGA